MLDREIRKQLDTEYEKTLQELSAAKDGSTEAKFQLEKLNELHKQRMAEEESEQLIGKQDLELKIEHDKLKEAKKNRIGGWVVGLLTTGATLGLTYICWRGGMHFEETGSYSRQTDGKVAGIMKLFKK